MAGDPQICGHGEADAAADAGTGDRGDHRFRAALNRAQRGRDCPARLRRTLGRGIDGLEFRNVCPGGKRTGRAAVQDHNLDGRIGDSGRDQLRYGLPHGRRQGVAFARPVEDEFGDRRGDFKADRQAHSASSAKADKGAGRPVLAISAFRRRKRWNPAGPILDPPMPDSLKLCFSAS